MKRTGYIGLDVGTSGCKASVVDERGNIIATARREYGLVYPGRGLVELDPGVVWAKVKETLKELAATDVELKMIAASSIGESLVMMDETDRVVRNAITYLDERGRDTIDQILSRIPETRIQRITGLPMRLFYSLNRLLWMQEHEPQSLERTRHYYMFSDFIVYMLSGERLIDTCTASKSQMLDVMNLDWSSEIQELFGIPGDRFSQVAEPGTIAGKIRPDLAEELGFPKSVRIVVGCHDQCSATLGSGGIRSGDLAAGEGSTESLNLVIEKEKITDSFFEQKICFEPYVEPDLYMVPVGQHTHGTSIRWFVSEFGSDYSKKPGDRNEGFSDRDIYELANETCAPESGNLFFVPHLTNSHLLDPDNRSLGAFIGVELETCRAQMYRAVLEGLCFETRLCFDALQGTGFPISRIVASGGCSRSPLFMQMKSDVLEVPVHILKNKDAGISALAMLCAVADGKYGNYTEAAGFFVKTEGLYTPQKSYQDKYERYKKIYCVTKQLYDE